MRDQQNNTRPDSIALLLPGFAGGGAERATIDLASAFSSLEITTDLIVPKLGGPLENYAREHQISIVDLQTNQVRYSVRALAAYLEIKQPEILIAAPNDTVVFAHLARRLAAWDGSVVGVVHSSHQLFGSSLRNRAVRTALRHTLPRIDLVVCVSHGVRRDLISRISPDETTIVITNPVDIRNVQYMASKPVVHPWVEDKSRPLVLGVGRLTWQKDFETLIRAFALLRLEVEDARLMILGEGELRPQLENLVQELNLRKSVSLPGFVDNPWSYMKRSSVFALSSRYEGLGLVLIEALACGTPVIATDCPSGPAEVLEHGRLGTLVPVGEPETMARALSRTIRSPRLVPDWQQLEMTYAPRSIARQFIDEFSRL